MSRVPVKAPKPPRGYRMVLKNEIIRKTDLVYTFYWNAADTQVLQWQKMDSYDHRYIGKTQMNVLMNQRSDYRFARRITGKCKGAK